MIALGLDWPTAVMIVSIALALLAEYRAARNTGNTTRCAVLEERIASVERELERERETTDRLNFRIDALASRVGGGE